MVRKILYVFTILLLIISCANIDNLINRGDYSGAESYCESLKDDESRNSCYRALAEAFLENGFSRVWGLPF